MKSSILISRLVAGNLLHLLASSVTGAETKPDSSKPIPLVRYDPYISQKDVISIQGNPRLGLPTGVKEHLQRTKDSKQWFLELNGCIARMELDTQSGEVPVKEVIKLEDAWCVSPDGNFIAGNPVGRSRDSLWACYKLATGESCWEVEKGISIYAARFSPDGKSLVALHTLTRQEEPPGTTEARGRYLNTSAVSWYDVDTGKLTRRVELPGFIDGGGDDKIAVTNDAVYVARPTVDGKQSYMIKNDDAKAVHIDIEDLETEEDLRVVAGGIHQELIAYYNDNELTLYHKTESGLEKSYSLEAPSPANGSTVRGHVSFSPDGKTIVYSNCAGSLVASIEPTDEPDPKQVKDGGNMGEFTSDGDFYVFFGDGGGSVFETKTWTKVVAEKMKDYPVYCCPVVEVGYSMNDDYIVSSDERRLLLWSAKDGKLLAQLESWRTDSDTRFEMQSAVIINQTQKIYAADGWDFMEWDLKEITEESQESLQILRESWEKSCSAKRAKTTNPNI